MPTDAQEKSFPELCVFIIDHGIHVFILVLLVYILWIPISHYRHLLSWHAILGVTAFLFLMSESIMMFSQNPWYTAVTRQNKVLVHGIIFGTATCLAVLATYFEYHRKGTRKGHGHFDSFHGVSALLATIFAVIACVGGLAVANCDWFREHIFNIRPVVLKLSHNMIGQTTYTLGMFSLCCAYYSNWVMSRTKQGERLFLVFVTGFVAIWTLCHALKSGYSQMQSLKDVHSSCDP